MSEHIIKIRGDDINNFLMFKIRENIEYGKPNKSYPLPIAWDMFPNTYRCNIECTDEQLLFIKLKYATS